MLLPERRLHVWPLDAGTLPGTVMSPPAFELTLKATLTDSAVESWQITTGLFEGATVAVGFASMMTSVELLPDPGQSSRPAVAVKVTLNEPGDQESPLLRGHLYITVEPLGTAVGRGWQAGIARVSGHRSVYGTACKTSHAGEVGLGGKNFSCPRPPTKLQLLLPCAASVYVLSAVIRAWADDVDTQPPCLHSKHA